MCRAVEIFVTTKCHVFIINVIGDNGSMYFWDWKTGYNFQKIQTTVQPGSLDSEAGIFHCCFDQSGCRLLTAEADKTIKIYKEDETAVSERLKCVPSLFLYSKLTL